MIPIFLCSVLAVFLILQKWFQLRTYKFAESSFFDLLGSKLPNLGKAATAQSVAEVYQNDLQVLICTAIQSDGSKESDAVLQSLSVKLETKMHRNMAILSSLVTIAPMIGLLGTVFGLVQIFLELSTSVASGDPTRLYAGVGIALTNTIGGLIIAIPCAFFYHVYTQSIHDKLAYFQTEINRLVTIARSSKA